MKTGAFAALLTLGVVGTAAATDIPLSPGTTWEYQTSATRGRNAPPELTIVRVTGTENHNGREVARVETHTGGSLSKTELIASDKGGLLCYQRTTRDGNAVSFDPPLPLVPDRATPGETWAFNEPATDTPDAHHEFAVVAVENVAVPGGTFRTVRLHEEEPWPLAISNDRWLAPGVGFVKEVTATRGPSGRLLSEHTMVLTKFTSPSRPPVDIVELARAPAKPLLPPSSPPPTTPQVRLEMAEKGEGPPAIEFLSDTPHLYVRWKGENLPRGGEARIAWIAEDVGDLAPANFIIDETTTEVTEKRFGARFTLSRPRDGWAPGKYRVDLFLNDALADTLGVTILEAKKGR